MSKERVKWGWVSQYSLKFKTFFHLTELNNWCQVAKYYSGAKKFSMKRNSSNERAKQAVASVANKQFKYLCTFLSLKYITLSFFKLCFFSFSRFQYFLRRKKVSPGSFASYLLLFFYYLEFNFLWTWYCYTVFFLSFFFLGKKCWHKSGKGWSRKWCYWYTCYYFYLAALDICLSEKNVRHWSLGIVEYRNEKL